MSAKTLQILLVDDNEGHIELVRRALLAEDEKFKLTIAGTLAEARKMLKKNSPDLMIVDYLLPDGKGTELLPGDPHKLPFPTVILTGHGDEKIATAAIKAGAIDYIVKSGETLADMARITKRILREWQHITERKKAEEALVESESKYRMLVDTVTALPWSYDIEKDYFTCIGDQITKVLGIQPEAMSNMEEWAELIHPDDRKKTVAFCSEEVKKGNPHEIEYRMKSVDGGWIWIRDTISVMMGEEGPVSLSGFMLDITKRKQAETMVQKLSQAMEQAGESIVITDREGVIEYVNPAFMKFTGYSAEEAIGQTPRILKSGNQNASFYDTMWETITCGKVWHGKVVDKRKDGGFYPAMLTISPIFDASGDLTHFVGLQSDLTELESLAQQFHQAQKMEEIGTLVGGIAHDFNNMLAGITGNLYLAKQDAKQLPDVVERLVRIEQISLRAADMIQQLLTFARKGMVSMKEMPFTPFIKETLKLQRTSVPENIAMHQYICTDFLQIRGDATQLHQILMNLVNNARDAVEGGDKPCISIRLEAFYPDDAFIETHADSRNKTYAHLSVEDNGCGIPEDQIEHLFEPFFTTKEQGKGTGLGLAMVFGAIKTHQGFVEAESKKGEGSTFHLYIPLLEPKEMTSTSVQGKKTTRGHGEMILLADDETHILETTREVLGALGYKVVTATNGREAVEIFEASSESIALCIFDIVMPVMNGDKAAQSIRRIAPHAKIIFSTGYDKSILSRMEDETVLTKPVSIEKLSHMIRQHLNPDSQK